MLPSYVIQHVRQELGFEGLNLAGKRHTEILKRTPEINAKSIRNIGDARYSVQSVTNSSHTYLVQLGTQSCDCPDWPRVELCKHVSIVAHFFGNGGQQIEVEVAPKTAQAQPVQEGSARAQSEASATAILENVIAISRAFLSDGAASSPETIRSLQMVETHLTTIVQNTCSPESPLPDKDAVPPNQGTWTETAERMGAKRHRKRTHPATMSPPEPPATERIGGLNHKKPHVKITDPYTRNTGARTQAAAAANSVTPPSQPPNRGPQYMGIPALSAPTSSVPLPPPAPHVWYPIPNAYPPGIVAFATISAVPTSLVTSELTAPPSSTALGLLSASSPASSVSPRPRSHTGHTDPRPLVPWGLSSGLYLTSVVSIATTSPIPSIPWALSSGLYPTSVVSITTTRQKRELTHAPLSSSLAPPLAHPSRASLSNIVKAVPHGHSISSSAN
ncbi:hypothetical protein EDB83DRAFT_2526083 [Lactarius deliciosus]|nr:hypothetical protein EDB83DRAFT_2526083 [Lactarius deliciosus]